MTDATTCSLGDCRKRLLNDAFYGGTGAATTKSFLTEYRLELGAFLVLLFSFLLIISTVQVWAGAGDDNHLPGYLEWLERLASVLGDWASWLVIISPIGLVISGWWLYDFVKKKRKLLRLLDTPSKAKFVRNLDDIEFLAWSLPRRYEKMVREKRKELKI